MKGISFVSFLLCVAFLVSPAVAQEKSFEFMIGGGVQSPTSPSEFKDGFNLGWTAKAAAGYFLTPQFTLGANFSYNQFGLDKNYFLGSEAEPGITISGGRLSIYEMSGVGKFYFGQPARSTNLYVLGGPGVAVSNFSDVRITTPTGTTTESFGTETDFMVTGGVGITQHLNSKWSLFLEGRYSYLLTEGDNTTYLPIRVGIIF